MSTPLYQLIEISVLAATLLATVFIASRVWRQTRRHFQLEHSRGFIERFNSAEMVTVRARVDEWLALGEPAAALTARIAAGDEGARATSAALRTLTNFFQELGVAHKHGAVSEAYIWDVFGALSNRYWHSLEPYVRATRERLGRPSLHRDFEDFAARMRRLDEVRRVPTVHASPAGAPAAWIFGYGSLLDPKSIERTVKTPVDRSRLRVTWLNGYRRGWTVWDLVEFEETPPRRVPLAFLSVTPDPGARCNGVLFPIDREGLEALDARERNYVRVDVSEAVETRPGGPVFTYVGLPEFAVFPPDIRIAERYLDLLEAGLDAWGPEVRAGYHASTVSDTDIERVRGAYHFWPEAPEPWTPGDR